MKIFSIYKATNKINGKIYIGFDSNWPRRFKDHNGLYDIKFSIFQKAIKKYGKNNFEWEVICQSLDGEYLLKVMEPYFIEYYNSFNEGYNMTLGGEGSLGKRNSFETRKKIGDGNRNKIVSIETRKKLSIAGKNKKLSENHKKQIGKAHKNKIVSIETREKQSKKRKGVIPTHLCKEYIVIFPCGKEEKISNLRKFTRDIGFKPDSLNYSVKSGVPYKGFLVKKI